MQLQVQVQVQVWEPLHSTRSNKPCAREIKEEERERGGGGEGGGKGMWAKTIFYYDIMSCSYLNNIQAIADTKGQEGSTQDFLSCPLWHAIYSHSCQ